MSTNLNCGIPDKAFHRYKVRDAKHLSVLLVQNI